MARNAAGTKNPALRSGTRRPLSMLATARATPYGATIAIAHVGANGETASATTQETTVAGATRCRSFVESG